MNRNIFLRCMTAAAVLMLLTAFFCADAETRMAVVKVGKGDAVIMQNGEHAYLIDCGKKEAEESIRATLESMGIDELDAVFLTHTDHDHTGGLKWLKKFPVKAVYASAYCQRYTREKHPAVKAFKKSNIDVQWLSAGDTVPAADGAVFNVLAPEMLIETDEDDNCLVMMYESSDGRILLTGDMKYDETMVLLSSDPDLHCDVLKVPNHGSSAACPYDLLEACRPQVAVISTDSTEKPDTPDPGLLSDLEDLGIPFYVTQDTDRGILVVLDRGNVSVRF